MTIRPRSSRSRLAHLLVSVGVLALTTTVATAATGSAPASAASASATSPNDQAVVGVQNVFVAGCAFHGTDLSFPNIANDGIQQVMTNVSDYFRHESNGLVVLNAAYWGWATLPDTAAGYQNNITNDPVHGPDRMLNDCKSQVNSVMPAGKKAADYKAVVMLFNDDLGFASQTDRSGSETWIHLRFTGGQGGWTSEATWVHELGHAFGLSHSTWFSHSGDNMYANDYDPMSAFGASTHTRWNFPAGGICNGITTRPRCLYADTSKAAVVPVGLPSFQKAKLGWITPETAIEPAFGSSLVQLSSPVYSLGGGGPVQLVRLPYGGDGDYYAIDLRRKDSGFFEQGLPAGDSLVVYMVQPSLDHTSDDAGAQFLSDWGDAVVVAVVPPGGTFSGHGVTFSYDYIQLDGRAMISFSRTDAMPPVTSLPDVSPFAWSRASDVRVVATDQPGGAGVATVYAAADDGDQCFDHWPTPCTPVTGPLHLGDGLHRITYWSVDRIGNVERPQEISIAIDTTPPVLVPSDLPPSSTWTNHDVAVHFTCSNGGGSFISRLVAGDPQQVVVTGEGAHLAVTPNPAGCADEAGNTAVVAPIGVNIDRTPPRLQLAGPQEGATYTLGAVPPLACTAADDLAGLSGTCHAGTTAPSAGNAVGAFTAAATAADLAGNTSAASASYRVVYGWSGLTSPTDTAPPVRAWATVRLQFALHDAAGRPVKGARATLRQGTKTVGTFTSRPGGIYRFDLVPSSIGAAPGSLALGISLDDGTTHPVTLTVR